MGQLMRENQEEILGLRKVFKIPNGVVLDQIRANYNEEEAILRICMPKFVKEIGGVQIEEGKEEELGESSHKAFNEFQVQVTEIPSFEIRNEYVESAREDGGKEESEEVKNSDIEQNVEDRMPEKSQEVPKNIVIQSSEESDDSVLDMETGEEIIGGRKEKGIEDNNMLEIEDQEKGVEEDISNKEGLEAWQTSMEREKYENVFPRGTKVSGEGKDIVEGKKLKEIEKPKHETEDRDIEAKEGIVELEFETEDSNKGRVEEEVGKGAFEAVETKVKELPTAQKEPFQMEEIDSVVEIIEGAKHTETEGPMFGRAKDETCKEGSHQAIETTERWEFPKTQKHVLEAKEKGQVFEAIENEEKGKTYGCGESGHQESQVPKNQNSEFASQESTKTILHPEVELLKSSQLESPLESQFVKHKHEVIGRRKSHGGREIEDEEANEQRDEVQVEIYQEIDELQDIQVEASEEDKANEQEDEIYVEVSRVEERREIKFKASEEKKKLQAPLVIAGSAFVVSLIGFFLRHRS